MPIVAAVAAVDPGALRARSSPRSRRGRPGPGTRANIDEFTETTARAIEVVGGAGRGKAIIVLNPAEPPLMMRDTVYCLCPESTPTGRRSPRRWRRWSAQVQAVRARLPAQAGRAVRPRSTRYVPTLGRQFTGLKVSVFLEVEGAGHYLPAYAGNLDIMTSAALRTAERLAAADHAEAVGAMTASAVHPGRDAARRHARHPPPVLRSTQVRAIAAALDAAGVDAIEVGPRRRPGRLQRQLRLRRAHRRRVDRGGGRRWSRGPS